jgi:CxxC motif-containing protein (DUF1111 family)
MYYPWYQIKMKNWAPYLLTLPLFGCFTTESSRSPSETSGGATTIQDATSAAFSSPASNLLGKSLELHMQGDAAFEATFVTAPSPVNGGLGPVFNNTSCVACHAGDGRGRPPFAGEALSSMLIRMSMPGENTNGGPVPVPGFGEQLQPRAVYGKDPEAQVEISYQDSLVQFSDGTMATLRIPRYQLSNYYQPMPAGVLISPRVAPPVFGLGLLEAVSEATILAMVDETDRNADGISGKANYAWDPLSGKKILSRFGWKANTPNLLVQSAAAYNNDMGITSWIFPRETCHGQSQGCDSSAFEVDSATLAAVTFYVQTLAVPARRYTSKAMVQRGEKLFRDLQCSACHIPEIKTGKSFSVSEVAGQTIQPFTDLLVHDMGQGLADGRPDFLATGSEWRTPPLWGIGLTEVVNSHTQFLHDGRARNLTEAILWHGGEGEASKEKFRNLSVNDRKALLDFLASL